MSPELQAILNLLSNLANFGTTPAGQALLLRLSEKSGLSAQEIHAQISTLPEPHPPKQQEG